jgi:hypothetical protein
VDFPACAEPDDTTETRALPHVEPSRSKKSLSGAETQDRWYAWSLRDDGVKIDPPMTGIESDPIRPVKKPERIFSDSGYKLGQTNREPCASSRLTQRGGSQRIGERPIRFATMQSGCARSLIGIGGNHGAVG